MKAKTMYEMVEELDAGQGPVKLLFLTNPQADSICSSSLTLRKMLEALEIDSPKLVINLINSPGLRASLTAWSESEYNTVNLAGRIYDTPPFLNLDEEQMCLARLDQFMQDILLPLAASTHALILTSAVTAECALSNSLSRSYKLQRAKWGAKPPFVILSVVEDLPRLYLNPDPEAYWRSLRRRSKAWKARDKAILETVHCYGYVGVFPETTQFPNYDLDKDAKAFLIVDQLTTSQQGFDSGPANTLRVEVLRFLVSTLPSLAVKTCSTNKAEQGNTSGYQICLDQANSGTKVLLLDVRKRGHMLVEDGGTVEDEERYEVVESPTTSPVTHANLKKRTFRNPTIQPSRSVATHVTTRAQSPGLFKSCFQGAGGNLKKEFLEEPQGTKIRGAIRMFSYIASGEIMQPYVSLFAAHRVWISSWAGPGRHVHVYLFGFWHF